MKKICTIFLSVFMMAASAEHAVQLGNLKIKDPYARATVPAQKAGGGFVKIENAGVADKLIGLAHLLLKKCSFTL